MSESLFRAIIFLIETFDAASGVDHFLFAREERMALRANFNGVVTESGARFDNGTTSARNFGGFIIRMNAFLHNTTSF